jgi:hypothetical protein
VPRDFSFFFNGPFSIEVQGNHPSGSIVQKEQGTDFSCFSVTSLCFILLLTPVFFCLFVCKKKKKRKTIKTSASRSLFSPPFCFKVGLDPRFVAAELELVNALRSGAAITHHLEPSYFSAMARAAKAQGLDLAPDPAASEREWGEWHCCALDAPPPPAQKGRRNNMALYL